MLLSKVIIDSFRTIATQQEIEIDPKITILLGANESGKTNLLQAMQCFSLNFNFQPGDISKSLRRKYERGESPKVSFIFSLFEEDREKLVTILPESKDWYILKFIKDKNNIEGYSLIIPKENKLIKSQNEIKEIENEIMNYENEISDVKNTLNDIKLKKELKQTELNKTNLKLEIIDELSKELDILNKDFEEGNYKLELLEENKKTSIEVIKNTKNKIMQEKDEILNIDQNKLLEIINILPHIIYIKDIEFLPESISITELIQQNTPKSKVVGNLLKIGELENLNTLDLSLN